MTIRGNRYATRQPKGLAPVRENNAIALDLLCAATHPAGRLDSLLGLPYTQDGAYALGMAAIGQGISTNGSSSAIWLPIKSIALTRFTLFGVFRSSSSAIDTRALSLGSSSDTNPIVQIGTGASTASKVRVFARSNASSTPPPIDSTRDAFDGTVHTISVTYDGANVSVYIDGRFDSSSALASATFTVDRFCIGALRRATTGQWWSGTTFMGAAWKRCLRADEIASLHDNPFQLIRAPNRLRNLGGETAGAPVSATASITEATDGASGTATVMVTGSASVASGADSAAGVATVLVAASAALSEAGDTLSAAAAVTSGIVATAAITEAADALSGAANVQVQAGASAIEADDIVAASSSIAVSSAGYAQDLPDSLIAAAPILLSAALSSLEQADGVAAVVDVAGGAAQEFEIVESQIFRVRAERRIYDIPAEDRILTVRAEARILGR